ncbi:hypothetical protein ABVF61_01530 [Roseibium sp. HPY-6]|uniref:hypothetical protein n=1 Tax=Roseibium sp. HPY-6 TaxID=3229852 RepID=UPI00338E6D6A
MSSSIQQKSRYKVVDIVDPANSRTRDRFETYRHDTVLTSQNDALVGNYTAEKFAVDDQIALYVIMDCEEDRICGFSSLFRPSHWPHEVGRVGNRSWIDKNFRSSRWEQSGRNSSGYAYGIRDFVSIMTRANVGTCKEHGIELMLITREAQAAHRNQIGRLITVLDKQLVWQTDFTGYYSTYPGQTRSCWQRAIFSELVPGARQHIHRIPRITHDEYIHRYSSNPILAK